MLTGRRPELGAALAAVTFAVCFLSSSSAQAARMSLPASLAISAAATGAVLLAARRPPAALVVVGGSPPRCR